VNIVVDVSVAIKWFVQENLYDEADSLLDREDDLHAPDLIIVELANMAWKKTIRKEIDQAQAREIIRNCRDGVPILHPSPDLAERALQIGLELNHPAYDCIYIACAEKLGSILVTADTRLARAVQATRFASRIVHLADFGAKPN